MTMIVFSAVLIGVIAYSIKQLVAQQHQPALKPIRIEQQRPMRRR